MNPDPDSACIGPGPHANSDDQLPAEVIKLELDQGLVNESMGGLSQ